MEKKIKNCYKTLDLPYDATVEDVRTKQKTMIKVYHARGVDSKKSFDKEIKKVNDAGTALVDFITREGVQKTHGLRFETTLNDIGLQVFSLVLSVIACVSIFLMLMRN